MDTAQQISDRFNQLWADVIGFIPDLITAIVLLIIGLIIAWFLEVLVKKVLQAVHFDELAQKIGLRQMMDKAGWRASLSKITAWIVYWFVLIVFLAVIVDVLGLDVLTQFISSLVGYIPSIIAAILIIVIGIWIGQFLKNLITGGAKVAKVGPSELLGNIAKWTAVTFAALAALVQLGIAPDLIRILFAGFIIADAIAFGLAFGLGGKDMARELLDQLKNKSKEVKDRVQQGE